MISQAGAFRKSPMPSDVAGLSQAEYETLMLTFEPSHDE